jgi:hypothetical protein
VRGNEQRREYANDEKYHEKFMTDAPTGQHGRPSKALPEDKLAPAQKSSYVGVSWSRSLQKWRAGIRHAGDQERLGDFVTEEEAARAFDDAARRLRGDAAHGGRTLPNSKRFR